MDRTKIKAIFIIFGISVFVFLTLVLIFSGFDTKEDKVNFPEYSNLKVKEKDIEDVSSESYKAIKERLENDYYFNKTALISNYDYKTYTSINLKQMLWNYIFAFELNNKKYLSSIDYNTGEFCMRSRYVINSFEELYGVKISKDIDYFNGYYEYVKSKNNKYCFNFANVAKDYNNEIKILIDGISVKDNVITANLYLFEYYVSDTEKELKNVEELKSLIKSTNVNDAINIVKNKLNGKSTHKQLQFVINNGGKFFKYQVLNSKLLDY